MNTLENTVSMMKTLPEADLLKIQEFTLELFKCRRENRMVDKTADEAVGRFLKPMSREDIMKNIEIAEAQFASGEYQNAGDFLAELRKEYGV